MNIQIFMGKKNFDCQKAERYFKERGIRYKAVDLGKKGLSPRELDAVLACGFSLSRGKAAQLIASGKAAVNHRECDKPDRAVEQGDVITCRGLGKCAVREVLGQSRKGRTMVVLERYL